jgi:hypothetical protein
LHKLKELTASGYCGGSEGVIPMVWSSGLSYRVAVGEYQRFKGIYFLQFQDQNDFYPENGGSMLFINVLTDLREYNTMFLPPSASFKRH